MPPTSPAIADAIALLITQAGESLLPGGWEVVRVYRAIAKVGDLSAGRVTVAPRGMEINAFSRADVQVDHLIDIAIQKKIGLASPDGSFTAGSDSGDALDELMELAQTVMAYFNYRKLDLGGGEIAQWVKSEVKNLYAPEHLAEQSAVFTCVATITFRTYG
jgi:hypothetical protein